ncbi:hypothetical protein V6N12_027887 [Hibiscus sabdariffa]|uniref:Disease resistance R13L4/SHOC-2-like LRR domain-containing protein n=1 Tax=Hibiscus sabdariffa TaxID=183260 RepID=A0ABR2F477_9ROSI
MSAADQSPLESEAKAVTGFKVLQCNPVGSITKIILFDTFDFEVRGRFGKLNFSSFPNLVHLDLGGCELGGNIPPQIGNLWTLRHLGLSTCNLSGELPPSLRNLTRLEFLHISYNGIHGPIPSTLGQLTNLQSLCLSGNQISESIPSEI